MPQKIHLFQLRIQDKRNPLEGLRMLYLALCHYLDLLLLDHTPNHMCRIHTFS